MAALLAGSRWPGAPVRCWSRPRWLRPVPRSTVPRGGAGSAAASCALVSAGAASADASVHRGVCGLASGAGLEGRRRRGSAGGAVVTAAAAVSRVTTRATRPTAATAARPPATVRTRRVERRFRAASSDVTVPAPTVAPEVGDAVLPTVAAAVLPTVGSAPMAAVTMVDRRSSVRGGDRPGDRLADRAQFGHERHQRRVGLHPSAGARRELVVQVTGGELLRAQLVAGSAELVGRPGGPGGWRHVGHGRSLGRRTAAPGSRGSSRRGRRGGRPRGAAPGDARAHRAHGHVEHLGDLGVVHALDVAEDHRHPELLGDPGQRTVDGETVGHAGIEAGRVPGWSKVSARRGRAGRRPPPAQLVQAGVGGDAVHPGAGRRPLVEAGQPADDGDQRLLRRVGGVGRVAGECGSTRHGSCRRGVAAGVERRAVAGPGRGDELAVARPPR